MVLGNPPWERIKLQEQEWFAERRPEIANARNAAERRKMISALAQQDAAPPLCVPGGPSPGGVREPFFPRFQSISVLGRGDVNTYTLFAEMNRSLINPSGRVGCIVPSGIATDDTTKVFFQKLIASRSLVSLYSFFEIRLLFPDTDSRNPFCLLTLTRCARRSGEGAAFVFDARSTEELAVPERRFALSQEDLTLLNPNTRTCPVFRSRRDAELTKAIYHRVPILWQEAPEVNPWGIRFLAMLHMANDSDLFTDRPTLEADGFHLEGNVFRRGKDEYLPLYEAKMLHHFDHRWASYEGDGASVTGADKKAGPSTLVMPRYWVAAARNREPTSWQMVPSLVSCVARHHSEHRRTHGDCRTCPLRGSRPYCAAHAVQRRADHGRGAPREPYRDGV